MALSQTQIIRSLSEALQWLEKELSWGQPIAELRHLTGRIGELYAAMITRGQMAMAVNQNGYDVVSAEGQKISVKTITSSTRVDFNLATLHHADRVMVLQIELDETEPSIKELYDGPVEELRGMLREVRGGSYLPVNRLRQSPPGERPDLSQLKVVASAQWKEWRINQLENGSILIRQGEEIVPVSKPVLREIAKEVGVNTLNAMDRPKNTRTLGTDIIRALA